MIKKSTTTNVSVSSIMNKQKDGLSRRSKGNLTPKRFRKSRGDFASGITEIESSGMVI